MDISRQDLLFRERSGFLYINIFDDGACVDFFVVVVKSDLKRAFENANGDILLEWIKKNAVRQKSKDIINIPNYISTQKCLFGAWINLYKWSVVFFALLARWQNSENIIDIYRNETFLGYIF